MTAQITDLLDRTTDSTTGRPVISSIASGGKAIGATSLNITDATNWTTTSAIHFSIYKVTAQNYKDPSTQTDWKGVLSGTTITNLTLTGGTDQAYVAGDKVELTPTARYPKDLYDWGITHANPDGTLKTTAVQNALNISTTSTDWTPLANVPTLSASNGQREHQLTWTGVDYTNKLQAGTKLQIPRTSTVPTQSAQFVAASSQYASKASPTGITFSNTYTAEATVNTPAYQAQTVISRTDGTNTWAIQILATGQIGIYVNSGGVNFRGLKSYQSIQLNKWTHIALALTTSDGSGAIYIDGVAVPTLTDSGGTIPTSITQAGTLYLGSQAAANYFNGTIAHVRLWSTIRTAQQIRDNANKSMTGSETGLVGAWSLNGDWTDKTANANTLTAAGGAIATYADNPWKATEYAIVTGISFTGGNTVATVFTGSNTLPNETLGSTSYSSARAPYGFPVARTRWQLSALDRSALSQPSPAANTWYNPASFQLSLPIGEWALSYQSSFFIEAPTGTIASTNLSLTAASANAISPKLTSTSYSQSGGGLISKHYGADSVTITSQRAVYLNGIFSANGTTMGNYVAGSQNSGGAAIYADCAFL